MHSLTETSLCLKNIVIDAGQMLSGSMSVEETGLFYDPQQMRDLRDHSAN
jgi:hypothetical protein